MAKVLLIVLFLSILIAMIAVTTYASLDRSILQVGPELTSDPWFHATLADAYFGFVTFFAWVAYKEPTTWRRGIWFVLIMALGNITMSVYVLIQLLGWDSKQGFQKLLLAKTHVD